MGTVRKVYLKFGIDLSYLIPSTDRTIDFARPILKTNLKDFKGSKISQIVCGS